MPSAKLLRVAALIGLVLPFVCASSAIGEAVPDQGFLRKPSRESLYGTVRNGSTATKNEPEPATGRQTSAEPGVKNAPGEPKEETVGTLEVPDDEVSALKKRIIEIQNSGKLKFRKLVPCSSVERFGVYSPLKKEVPTSTIVLYVEPANYGTLVTQDRYVIDCTVDVAVFTAQGKIIGGKEGILRINRVCHSPTLDLYFKVQVNLKKPLAQDMVIKTRLRDSIKNDSVTGTLRINVKPQNKAAQGSV